MTTKSAKGHNFVSWFCCRACCLPYCRLIAFICLACCLFYYLFSYLYCWLYCRLFCRLFRKLCGHKVFIGNTCRQFACLFQNVFQKLKAFSVSYTHLDVYKRQIIWRQRETVRPEQDKENRPLPLDSGRKPA